MPVPWKLSDAPDDFIETMMTGIVGLQITVTKLQGKAKVSQNRPTADRQGVVEGLQASKESGTEEMARLVAATLDAPS